MSTRPRCMALTAAGDQCRKRAAVGSDFCGVHRPAPKIGRPTKLTPELISEVAARIATGAHFEAVAVASGIGRATLYRWLEKGEADEEHDVDSLERVFRDAVSRATAEAEEVLAGMIRRHALDDWRAAAFLLERRNPAVWGKRDRVEHSGTVRTGEVERIAPSSEEAALEVARILADAGAITAAAADAEAAGA